MADQKISALTAATSLADTDELVIASSGTTKKITAANVRLAVIPERRHDWSGSTAYEGWAIAGTAESSASWRLTKIVVASAGTVTVTHATNSWSNHLTASYS